MTTAAFYRLDDYRQVPPSGGQNRNSPSRYNVDVQWGTAGLKSLKPEWVELIRRAPGALAFQTHEFVSAWAETHVRSDSDRFATICIRDCDRLIAVFPCLIRGGLLYRSAMPAGSPISQYDDIAVDPSADLEAVRIALVETLRHQCGVDLLLFSRVRSDSIAYSMMGRDAVPLCLEEEAPYTDISAEGPDAYYKSRKRKVRKELRRHRRHIESLGSVAVSEAGNTSEIQLWIDEALALKRTWLVETGRLSQAFVSENTAACVKAIAWRNNKPGLHLRAFRLSLGQKTAAMALGFQHAGTFYHFLAAYDVALAPTSPGSILKAELIARGSEFGIRRFDMMAPSARDKLEWSTGSVIVRDLVLPTTPRGRNSARFVCLGFSAGARKTFYRMPLFVRRAIARATLAI